MFSGIVTHTGKVKKIIKKKNNCTIEVISNLKFSKNEIGSSISCSGVCLTLEKYRGNTAKFFLSKETLSKSIFKSVKKGHIINLEKSLKFGDRMSGHFVQGHVDVTCVVKKIAHINSKKFFISQMMLISQHNIKWRYFFIFYISSNTHLID